MAILNGIKEAANIRKYGSIQPITDTASYHEFADMEEADRWGLSKYSGWASMHKEIFRKLSHYKEGSVLHVPDPVDMYLGNDFKRINAYLRSGKSDPPAGDSLVRISSLIMSVYSAPVIGQKIILYRQVPADMINEMIAKNKERTSSPYQEKGFMSTSMIKTICADNCGKSTYMLKMYVDDICPVHAVYANAIRARDEAELLLPPDLFMWMSGYPYKDTDTGKTIYEVHLFSMNQ